jgi:hypothetical protein
MFSSFLEEAAWVGGQHGGDLLLDGKTKKPNDR